MKILYILIGTQIISTIIACFEENELKTYILLSLTLISSCLLLASNKLPQKYQQLFQRLMLFIQTFTTFSVKMDHQFIVFQAIFQMIIQFQIPPIQNKWVNDGYFLAITSTMLLFKTNLVITHILRSIFCALGVTYAYSQRVNLLQRQESRNKTNISLPMPSMRALKAQSSTYCRDSLLDKWDQMIITIDDQLKIKRISDKLYHLLDEVNLSRDNMMEKFIITKIDRCSKIKLGLHNGDCTLIDLLQQIKQISFAMQILVLDCQNQFFNDYLIRILYNEHEFEIQFIDIREREFFVRRKYLYSIMKQLFSTISHEFGTAFNYILALSSTNSDNYEHNFKQIRNQSLIMHHFVLDMVDYNDILGKSFKLQIQQIDILLILHQVKTLFEYSINEKSIQLDIINLVNQDIVISDARRIKQILIHLLQNAQKFTFKGSIKITAKPLSDGYVQFIVEDTGIGISEETANKMRQLFISDYKPESQLSQNAAGFGLGCYLSNKLAIYLSGLPYNAGGGLQFQQLETGMRFWFKVRNTIIPVSINFSDQSSGIQKISKNMYFDIRQSILQKSQSIIKRQSKKQSSHYLQSIKKLESSQMDQIRESKIVNLNNNNIVKDLQTITSNDQDQINDEEKSKDFPQRLQNKGKRYMKPKSIEITLPFIACRCVPFLIVDDEMINILGLQLLLKSMGYLSDFAFNGREALIKLDINQNSHCKYAGIFMDINMPIMDGYQTTQEINRIYKGNKPCIIACTAFTDADTKQTCYNVGMQQFINKPVNIGDLFGIAQFLNL